VPPPWEPTWAYGRSPGNSWAEFTVAGGGIVPESVWVEKVDSGTTSKLSNAFNRWAGGVAGLKRGTTIVLHARDVLGGEAQTLPFRYLDETELKTDPCRGTPRSSSRCEPLARGLVTFTIDDSSESQANVAVPLLRSHGVKATFFHVPNFLEWTDLAHELALEGHEVGAHTMTHRRLTNLTPAEVDEELRLSKEWLELHVSAPVESFASPSGAYNAEVVEAIKPHFKSHRTTNPGLNYTGSDLYTLRTDFVLNRSTAEEFCAQMTQAAALKGWLVLTFHDFTSAPSSSREFTVPAELFEALLTCAKNTPGLDVVTMRQGVEQISCSP
jgi:peptidoglycan/xylan/chitin deacetylase (PgdA/CDA1 family)